MAEIHYNDRFTLAWAPNPSYALREYQSWYMPIAVSDQYCAVLTTDAAVPPLEHEFKGGSGVIKNLDAVQIAAAEKVPAPYTYLSIFKDLYLYYYKNKSRYAERQTWTISIKGGSPVLTDGAVVSFKNHHYTHQYMTVGPNAKGLSNKSSEDFFIVRKLKNAKITNVVVLMLENRSYYRFFGRYHPGPYTNKDKAGKVFTSKLTKDRASLDPPHEINPVSTSLEAGKTDGFIVAYEEYYLPQKKHVSDAEKEDLMGYYPEGFLPAVDEIIKFGYIPTYWYSALPGPTWPNRMFAVSGSSFGWDYTPEGVWDLRGAFHRWCETHPLIGKQQWSIFDVMRQNNISFCVYTADWNPLPLWKLLYWNAVGKNRHWMSEFKKAAAAGTLPTVSFIEPGMLPLSVLNDDHPPHDPIRAQDFIAEIYEALRQGPNWANTLFLVTYDEHGGFFDPVYPPPAPVPDDHSLKNKAFAQEGVRVPTFIISPWVKASFDQDHKETYYDHTSILRFILEQFAPDRLDSLGKRVAATRTIPTLDTPRPLAEFPMKLTRVGKPSLRKIEDLVKEDNHFDETAHEVEALLREYYPQPRALNNASLTVLARSALAQLYAYAEPIMTPLRISIRTGATKRAGAKIYVQLFGEQWATGEIPLVANATGDFDDITFETNELGNFTRIRIFDENSGPAPGWLLEHVTVTNTFTNRVWEFECNKWLDNTLGDRAMAHEFIPMQAPHTRALATAVTPESAKTVVALARTRVALRYPDELNDLQKEYLAMSNYYMDQELRQDAGMPATVTTTTVSTPGGNVTIE